MKFAQLFTERIEAEPKFIGAICPICKEEVIAKCGDLNIWHWAHKSKEDCDKWSEGETEWHLNWKNEFSKEEQEVIVEENKDNWFKDYKIHRADIKTNKGLVVELQNSSISNIEIIEREVFYDKMIWLINGEKFAQNIFFRKTKGNDYYTFRWKYPHKSFLSAKKRIYVDMSYRIDYLKTLIEKEKANNKPINNLIQLNNELKRYTEKPIFLLSKIYYKRICGGYGRLISKNDFLNIHIKKDDTTKTSD